MTNESKATIETSDPTERAPDADERSSEPTTDLSSNLLTQPVAHSPRRDPLAIALANASLTGAGYLLLGRRALAAGAAATTIALLAVLTTVAPFLWFELVVAAWWIVLIGHGFHLARKLRRPARTGVRRQRLVAGLCFALPLVLIFGWFRWDAATIETTALDEHRARKCGAVLSTLDGLWLGHRLADAPLVARAELATEACQMLLSADAAALQDRIRAAGILERYGSHPGAAWSGAADQAADLYLAEAMSDFRNAQRGELTALDAAFRHIGTVLQRYRDTHGARAMAIVTTFTVTLPTFDACVTSDITGWLRGHGGRGAHDGLRQALLVVPDVEPKAMVECGDQLMDGQRLKAAREIYRELGERYPKHQLAPRAERGEQLANVKMLLNAPGPNGKPQYCATPARYSGAKPYRGGGGHPALFYGNDELANKLPRGWKAPVADVATLVVCAGGSTLGAPVETCLYQETLGSRIQNFTFHKKRIYLRVYELRTGRAVVNRAIEISGGTCPGHLPGGSPAHLPVRASAGDFRAAYGAVINP